MGRGRPSAPSLRPPPPALSSPPRAPNRRRPRWEGRPRHVARSPPPLFQAGQSRLQRPQLPGPRAAPRGPTACPALPTWSRGAGQGRAARQRRAGPDPPWGRGRREPGAAHPTLAPLAPPRAGPRSALRCPPPASRPSVRAGGRRRGSDVRGAAPPAVAVMSPPPEGEGARAEPPVPPPVRAVGGGEKAGVGGGRPAAGEGAEPLSVRLAEGSGGCDPSPPG